MTDKPMIIDALKLWFQPGDVFEIRVLDALTAEYMRPHVESGYFDFEHIPQAADALAKIRSYRGAYATVNPVNPDLLGRACNRLRAAGREPTSSDADILSRRWLLIDCDAVRPAGISSSDEEHEVALAKAREIKAGLASLSWPEPIMLDSGNGAQLMYRVQLPADDGCLVQKCIESIALASSEQVKVDLTVHNPARIWRIPGTMNCKGDSIPARPHRMAKLLSASKRAECVSLNLLNSVVSGTSPRIPSAAPLPAGSRTISDEFDLDAWIAKYCPELGKPLPWNGGRKWIFPVCPFNDAHTNRSAVLMQHANGAVAFTCHHNSCSGNGWKKLRALKEPGCYERKTESTPVDLSGILSQKPRRDDAIAPSAPGSFPGALPFPDELYNVPGLVGEVIEFNMETAAYPNRGVAFAAALAIQAHLSARKIETPLGARTNPYIIALAKSGSGKDHPRKVNRRILCNAGLGDELQDNIASAQGLEDALIINPAILWQADEFYSVLNEIINDKSGTKETLMKYLLTFFTSANEEYTTRSKAGKPGTKISCPNLTLLGTCTPGTFFDSLNERILTHGMFSRMTIIQADSRKRSHGERKDFRELNEFINSRSKAWADFRPKGSGNLNVNAITVPVTRTAAKLLDSIQNEADMEYERIEQSGGEDWKLAVWTRAFESVTRYALIYACSEAESPEMTIITEDAVLWAKKFIWWESNNKIAMTEYFYHESDFEKYSEEIIRILSNWHRRKGFDTPMPGWVFNRRTRKFPPNVLAAVQKSLISQDRIAVEDIMGNGRYGKAYKLIDISVN